MANLSRFEIRVAKGKIIDGNPVDGVYMLVSEEKKAKSLSAAEEKLFMEIEPSKLSLDDKFMKHSPRTFKERCFMDLLTGAINHKVENFYCPRYAPSLTEDGKSFCYKPGKMPAVGKSYTWWESEARRFMHDRESRLGTKEEYALYLGTLMKKMVELGYAVRDVWKAVCNESGFLGNYCDYPTDISIALKPTGQSGVWEFCDLANTYKLLIENEAADSFWLASGSFSDESTKCPIANIEKTHDHSCFEYHSVGWVVFR